MSQKYHIASTYLLFCVLLQFEASTISADTTKAQTVAFVETPLRNLGPVLPGVDPYSVHISKDGTRAAYVQNGFGSSSIVLNGIVTKFYDNIDKSSLSMDDQGETSFIATERGRSFVVTNGVDGRSYDSVDDLRFTDDGHTLYRATNGKKQCYAIDGKEQGWYDSVREGWFYSSANVIVFIGRQHDKDRVFFNGSAKRRFDNVEFMSVSSDMQHVAFVAKNRSDILSSLVIDNKVIYKAAFIGAPEFSPTDSVVATTSEGTKSAYVVDGQVLKAYDSVDGITFDSSGQHYAYTATLGSEKFVVRDGVESPKHYLGVSWPHFIGGGSNDAYFASATNSMDYNNLVVNGVEQDVPGTTSNGYGYPLFTHDGTHYVYECYTTDTPRKSVLVVDGIVSSMYDSMFGCWFIGRAGDTICEAWTFPPTAPGKPNIYAVVDGVQSPIYDHIWWPTSDRVAAPNYFYGLHGIQIYRVDVKY